MCVLSTALSGKYHPHVCACACACVCVCARACADKSLALDIGSGAVAKSSAEMEENLARSHDFCWCELGPEGCGSLRHLDH